MMTLTFLAKSQLGQSPLCQSAEQNFSLDSHLLSLSHLFMPKATGEKNVSNEKFRQQLSIAEFIVCLILSFIKRSGQKSCLDPSYTREVMSFPLLN